MSLRFHEIAEQRHRILNPFTDAKLQLLSDVCQLQPGMRLIDLCCGKGEMLCQWAAKSGIVGTGVDISPVFLAAARERALALQCAERVAFIEADAATYPIDPGAFDVISCIGATWIGGGLVGTLERMRPGLQSTESLMLVGDPIGSMNRPTRRMQRLRMASATCSPRSQVPSNGSQQQD